MEVRTIAITINKYLYPIGDKNTVTILHCSINQKSRSHLIKSPTVYVTL